MKIKTLKKVMVFIFLFCSLLGTIVYAAQGYPEWYYERFGDYPEGTVLDWENDPVYHQYLNETGGGGGGGRRYEPTDQRYYPRPNDLYWSGRTAKWSVEGWASKYQVALFRDGSRVCTKTTTGRSISFSSYMSRGDNDYFFRVRAYNKDAGWWSDWEESDIKEVRNRDYDDDEDISGPGVRPTVIIPGVGPGEVPSVPQAGKWIKTNGFWHYQYNNGTFVMNTWFKVDGKWYFFDINGNMLTGWLNDKGKTYFLGPDGAMFTGTAVIDGITHFFDSTGAMIY